MAGFSSRFIVLFLCLLLSFLSGGAKADIPPNCPERILAPQAATPESTPERHRIEIPEPVLTPGNYTPAERVYIPADPSADRAAFEKQETLKIATWNVENLFYRGGKEIPNPSTGHRYRVPGDRDKAPKQLREVVGRLDRIDADILGLQEVELINANNSLKNLVDIKMGGRYIPLVLQGNDGRSIQVAAMVKKGLPFDIEYESNRDLPWKDPFEPPLYPGRTRLFSRDVGALILSLPGGSDPYGIYLVVHGKSKRTETFEDPESVAIRIEEQKGVAALSKYYQARYPRSPVFVMGDLNGEMREPAFQPLRDCGLKEAFDVLPDGKFVPRWERLSHSFHPRAENGRRLPPIKGQLDYILVDPLASKYVLSTAVVRPLDWRGREKPLANSYRQRQRRGGSDHDAREAVLDNQARLSDMGVKNLELQPPRAAQH